MGGWAVAQSPILVTTITLDRLKSRGYESMLDLYLKIAPHLNEPSRHAVSGWCERRSPSAIADGAVYSIGGSLFFYFIFLLFSLYIDENRVTCLREGKILN